MTTNYPTCASSQPRACLFLVWLIFGRFPYPTVSSLLETRRLPPNPPNGAHALAKPLPGAAPHTHKGTVDPSFWLGTQTPPTCRRMAYTGCPKKCITFVLFIVSIVSNTASSDLHQKIASFMEIYRHYLWTLSRVHGSH